MVNISINIYLFIFGFIIKLNKMKLKTLKTLLLIKAR